MTVAGGEVREDRGVELGAGPGVAGLSARQIADQLGHAKPSLTQDVYMGRNVVSAEAARVLDR